MRLAALTELFATGELDSGRSSHSLGNRQRDQVDPHHREGCKSSPKARPSSGKPSELMTCLQAVFTTLTEAKMAGDADLGNGILLTGKGYPDVATRELLKRLSDNMPAYVVYGALLVI